MLSREERKRKRAYKKMMKQTKKDLIKASKKFRCWDEGFLFAFMRIIFNCWKDYYRIGWNVWAVEQKDWDADSKDHPTREEVATELLRLMDNMDNSWYEKGDGGLDNSTKKLFDYMAEYIHYMWD